jgi:hypothetical protein
LPLSGLAGFPHKGSKLLQQIAEAELVPRVSEVQWFWRVTQAVPDAPLETRAKLAATLQLRTDFEDVKIGTRYMRDTTYEGTAKMTAFVQWYLAYQPWRSPKDKKALGKLPKGYLEMEPLMRLLASSVNRFGDAPPQEEGGHLAPLGRLTPARALSWCAVSVRTHPNLAKPSEAQPTSRSP